MKSIYLILCVLLISCSEANQNLPLTDGQLQPETHNYAGVDIQVRGGDNNYFLKMLDEDSLFVNVVKHEYSMSYIYFTKGNRIKTLSWVCGGKYPHLITNCQK